MIFLRVKFISLNARKIFLRGHRSVVYFLYGKNNKCFRTCYFIGKYTVLSSTSTNKKIIFFQLIRIPGVFVAAEIVAEIASVFQFAPVFSARPWREPSPLTEIPQT